MTETPASSRRRRIDMAVRATEGIAWSWPKAERGRYGFIGLLFHPGATECINAAFAAIVRQETT